MRGPFRIAVVPIVAFAVGLGAALVSAVPWNGASAGAARRTGTTTTTKAAPTAVPARIGIAAPWVALENAKPGTADWNVTQSKDGAIEGYVSRVSAQRGESLTLYVSSGETFHVEAYRLGWYQGLGGRLVWRSPDLPGVRQPPPDVDPDTHMVEAHWQPSTVLTIPPDWPPGVYVLKLVTASNNQQLVPLTIRDDTSDAAYMVMDAVTTWQAYNTWGGCSLYTCGGGDTGASRADVVSFDRPYATGDGAADLRVNEFPLIRRVEEWGLDVTYTTDVDFHEHPELALRHKALVSLGHDEYWSKAMFEGAVVARDAGVNLAFLGANAIYRQIRLGPSPLGPDRHQINYRSTDDPISSQDPSQTTVSWRQAPVNRPENTLIGEEYECNPVAADLVVTDPGAWIYSGTGVTQGEHLHLVIGSEYDNWQPDSGVPPNVEVMAHSPVTCRGRSSYSDVTYYSAPSGAGVFASGTNDWISNLDPPGPGSSYNGVVVAITANVLQVFGAGPAGRVHPSVSNTADLPHRSVAPGED